MRILCACGSDRRAEGARKAATAAEHATRTASETVRINATGAAAGRLNPTRVLKSRAEIGEGYYDPPLSGRGTWDIG